MTGSLKNLSKGNHMGFTAAIMFVWLGVVLGAAVSAALGRKSQKLDELCISELSETVQRLWQENELLRQEIERVCRKIIIDHED